MYVWLWLIMYVCVCYIPHPISIVIWLCTVCVHMNIYTVSMQIQIHVSHILPYIASFTTRGIEQNVLPWCTVLFRSRKCCLAATVPPSQTQQSVSFMASTDHRSTRQQLQCIAMYSIPPCCTATICPAPIAFCPPFSLQGIEWWSVPDLRSQCTHPTFSNRASWNTKHSL